MRTIVAAALAAIGTAAPASAAFSWAYFPGSDAAFNAITNNGALERAVSEARIGNNALNGTWEQAIWQQGGVGTPQAQAQFSWGNNVAIPFSLVYDGASAVEFIIDGQSISWTGVAGSFTDMFIRVRSAADSTLNLTDLELVGSGLNIGDLGTSGAVPAEYIRIENMGNAMPAFQLNGVATLSWTSPLPPANSALAYQVKLTNVIPEPATGMLLAIAALILRSRR